MCVARGGSFSFCVEKTYRILLQRLLLLIVVLRIEVNIPHLRRAKHTLDDLVASTSDEPFRSNLIGPARKYTLNVPLHGQKQLGLLRATIQDRSDDSWQKEWYQDCCQTTLPLSIAQRFSMPT